MSRAQERLVDWHRAVPSLSEAWRCGERLSEDTESYFKDFVPLAQRQRREKREKSRETKRVPPRVGQPLR